MQRLLLLSQLPKLPSTATTLLRRLLPSPLNRPTPPTTTTLCQSSSHAHRAARSGTPRVCIKYFGVKINFLTVRRQALPRFPFRIQRCQPGPLSPRARQGTCGTSLETYPELARILQRCLPSLRRDHHQDAGLRHGHAHEHWCRGC